MSWLEWRGTKWEANDQEATLNLHLWRPNAGCERQSWNFDLHQVERKEPVPAKGKKFEHWLVVSIDNLGFHQPDWRRWENYEIKADAAWHEATETHEYGRVSSRAVEVMGSLSGKGLEHWIGHDYHLRFGKRDGDRFSFELEAWLMPREEYYRQEPETEEELRRFGEGPPTLRVLGIARLGGINIDVPKCGMDPIPFARKYLREETGLSEVYEPKIDWALRQLPNQKESQRMEGWTSTVHFNTLPSLKPDQKDTAQSQDTDATGPTV